jgi:hypothetical protein
MKHIESQLFTWEEWDTIDEGVYDFSYVTLTDCMSRLHCWEVGKEFSHAVVDFQTSSVTFYDTPEDEKGHSFELCLSVGRKLIKRP